ncbi:U4/U6.U5 tri-snRNP-associated protein 1, partial [Phenoliferia sp. Uapishka_3]
MSEWKESISLEETNKIRISLGLKPISDAPSASKTSEALAEENFQKRKDEEAKDRQAAALKARIDKARNTRERGRKLVGAGLGEDEMEGIKQEEGEERGDGAKNWVKQQKKRAKELAKKREKEQEEMDKRAEEEGLAKYGEEDLKGIKVAHGQDDFEEGEETILTLKDSRVLDDEDDELHNLNISENSKTAEALALKKKGAQAGQYTGYDDEEFEGEGGKASVLKKYDEEIEGKEEGGFRLGGPALAKRAGAAKNKAKEEEPEKERVKLSMDYTKTFTTDYLQEDEVGFKKPKKKKKRPMRAALRAGSDEDGDAKMDDAGPSIIAITRVNLDDTNLIDDDDLQAQLSRTRREANKRKIAEMKAQAAANPAPAFGGGMDVDRAVKAESDDEDNGPVGDDILIMDDTSEFVRNISLAAAAPARPSTNGVVIKGESTPAPPSMRSNGAASVVPVIKSEDVDVPIAEVGGWGSPREDGEESDGGEGMDVYSGDIPSIELSEVKDEDAEDAIGGVGEILVSKGMASTLSILRQQGLIKERTPEELARDKSQKEREAWLAMQRRRDAQRALEKQRSKEAGSSKDQQQREYENRMRDKRDAEEAMRAFDNYKPVVNITYHDEFGRDQTPKEAWRQLSHNFHGHGGGSKKTEKRLKKIADEQKQQAMASGDTPLSTASAFAARSERMGSATMVLSVGNKGAAPRQEEILGSASAKLAKKGDKGKGKATDKTARSGSSAPAMFPDIAMRALPLPASESTSRSGSPAVRAGFAPIGSFSPLPSASDEGNREVKEKFILPTSLVRKRNAVVEPEGSPASKR